MSTPNPQSPFVLVVGLDFTDAGGFAFGEAARIARRIPASHLHLLHVFGGEEPSPIAARDLVGRIRVYVNEKAASVGGFPGITVGIHLRAGDPAREIARFSSDVSADLIVLGAHKGPHLKEWFVGSVAERIVGSAPCPVLVAGPKPSASEKPDPSILPPCPDCLRTRATTHGSKWWCEKHAIHAGKAHTFSYQRELPFAVHDSEVIPTGIDF
jgi:nucleotide-binding universal stress UspA family protein